jgi:hypothetical protein
MWAEPAGNEIVVFLPAIGTPLTAAEMMAGEWEGTGNIHHPWSRHHDERSVKHRE